MKYSDISVTPQKGDIYVVNVPVYYKDVVVPKGYKTNGANIPRIFWSLFPPNKSDFLPAVIVHDYLCAKKLYKIADVYFDEILIALNVVKWHRLLLVYSVKTYHRVRYSIK